jgi:hypothetical protein
LKPQLQFSPPTSDTARSVLPQSVQLVGGVSLEKVMNQKDIDRFLAKVNKTDDCWIWTGCLNSDGYGNFRYKGRTISAHRFSYIVSYGEIPEAMSVCHHCDVRNCINPSHLFLGTHLENMRDCSLKKRIRQQLGEKNNNAVLTSSMVLKMRSLYANGVSFPEIQKIFNTKKTATRCAIKGITWKHV